MTVTVYVWRFRKLGLFGIGNVGHASIAVNFAGAPDRSFYLSWWPGGRDVHGFGRRALRHTDSHSLQVGYGQKAEAAARNALVHAMDDKGNLLYSDEQLPLAQAAIESDKTAEGRSADAKYKFNLNGAKVLNETRMEAAFHSIHQGNRTLSAKGHAKAGEYSLVHQNCSDAVAWLLEAGGAGMLFDKPRMRFFWTPTDIAKWCDQLVIASNDKISKSAQRVRGFTGNNLDFTEHDWQYNTLATCS